MKYLQQVRDKWIFRITVPDELRDIIGVRELVEKDLLTVAALLQQSLPDAVAYCGRKPFRLVDCFCGC